MRRAVWHPPRQPRPPQVPRPPDAFQPFMRHVASPPTRPRLPEWHLGQSRRLTDWPVPATAADAARGVWRGPYTLLWRLLRAGLPRAASAARGADGERSGHSGDEARGATATSTLEQQRRRHRARAQRSRLVFADIIRFFAVRRFQRVIITQDDNLTLFSEFHRPRDLLRRAGGGARAGALSCLK